MTLLERWKKWNNKMEVRMRKPLPYTFRIAFNQMVIIYLISTLFDFTLTYITFQLKPDYFFKYEFSYVIKKVFVGDELYLLIAVIGVLFPIWLCYKYPMHFKKKYGYHISASRYYLVFLFMGSGLHIFGGMTNFIYIISL